MVAFSNLFYIQARLLRRGLDRRLGRSPFRLALELRGQPGVPGRAVGRGDFGANRVHILAFYEVLERQLKGNS